MQGEAGAGQAGHVQQSGPVFVLVRPQMGENIGAAARVMRNFGLVQLRVVAPRDGWPNPRAVAMASGAGALLDAAGPFPDVPAAIADAALVLATTARPRGIATPVIGPGEAMAAAHAAIAAGQRVAVLFGPERAGLETQEVALARAIVTLPVDPSFPSLNLAQCVGLMAHEWRRAAAAAPTAAEAADPAAGTTVPSATATATAPPATADEVARLCAHFDERLEEAGFYFPPEKAAHMRLSLRAMLGRLALTRGDVQFFHGVLRQLARGRRP